MASHREEARLITENATKARAGRVALRTDGKYVITKVNEVEIAAAIKDHAPQHYKLQAREEGRWVDVARLRPVSAPAPGLAAIRAGIAEASTVSTIDLAQLSERQPAELARALHSFSQRLNDQLAKDLSSKYTQPALDFLERLAAVHDGPQAGYLHANVVLFDALAAHLNGERIDEADTGALDEIVRARTAAQPHLFSTDASNLAVVNMLGKIHSLTNRDTAASYFETVRRDDTHGLIEHFYADMGARTYIAEPQPGGELTREIQRGIASLDAGDPSGRTGLVVSVDPKFYRVYAPTMYYYAQQMPDVDYNIVICADRAEAENAVADGDAYRSALATLNRSGAPRNVHHYQVDVPPAVAQRTTFYACARFFAAQMMLERYRNVFLMDADFTSNVDPRPFLKRVEKLVFGASRSHGFAALSPWRRIMAGSIPMSREVLGTGILDALTSYLAHGLTMEGNWMLDQNALAYTSELFPSSFTDLREYKRAFYQPPFRSVWERNYRA